MTSRLLDAALDLSVVGGYTNIGYRIRSRQWRASELRAMDGRSVMITGATSGVGLAAAEGLARLGASVHLAVRDVERAQRTHDQIVRRSGNSAVTVESCDVSDLGSVVKLAERFRRPGARLDVLVNNAGVLTQKREMSADGFELTFATNVLGPFLLTNLLLPTLARRNAGQDAPGRVINVSSGGMYTQRLAVEDPQSERGEFSGPTAYAQTKRAQVALTEVWAKRVAPADVVVHAMHPGWVNTRGLRDSLPGFYRIMRPLLRTPAQGADTIMWLGTAREPTCSSGRFWHDRRPRPAHLLPRTREPESERERLWQLCAELSGWPALTERTDRSGTLPSVDRHPAHARGGVRIPE